MSLVDLVEQAYEAELAALDPVGSRAEHLRVVRTALAHRANLEDAVPTRRAAMRTAAREQLDRIATSRQVGGDPYGAVVDAALEVVATHDAAPIGEDRALDQLIQLLIDADLPEQGSALDPQQEQTEAQAMDWLGLGEEEAAISRESIQRYLRARDARFTDATVIQAARLSGGFSKHTTLIQVDGSTADLVLRQVPPGRPAQGLEDEYRVLEFAFQRGVPVPEPLWLEREDSELGGPFIACGRVEGENQGDVFGPKPGVDPAIGHELARQLAAIHGLDVGDLDDTPMPPMASVGEIISAITAQEVIAAVAAGDPDIHQPLFALVFAWLRGHVPSGVAPVLVHGDIGFHNLLVDHGTVRGLLDWERATVGDPAVDLAYVKPQVESLMPWTHFVDTYMEAGGHPVPDTSIRYYTVWQDIWRAAGALKGRGRFLANPVHLIDAVVGLLHAPRFLHSAVVNAFEVPR
ncbi:MAG: phosphotransferase family protein [Acidimicrobiia bacterium]